MKTVVLILLTICACLGRCESQFLGGIFDQQATELKYYETQIAYLELYIGYLEKGYKIAQAGLTKIADIKKGEFNLHQVFFSSLSSVNPSIGNYAKVADIIALQLSIISNFKKALQNTSHFSSAEISYLQSVYSNLSSECSKCLTELINIITDGTMTMHDDERIKRIDNIYGDMKDKYAFTQSFTSQASVLAAEREDEQYDIDYLNGLY
jgi:hypothetical protein